MLLIEDTAAAWTDPAAMTEDQFDGFRETLNAGYYGPADDDDHEETPVEVVVPWGTDGEYDDDRRRAGYFPGRHLLHLDADEWELIDDLTEWRVPLRGIGSRCAHTPHRLPAGLVGGCEVRPSPVLGGTFIIFPGE